MSAGSSSKIGCGTYKVLTQGKDYNRVFVVTLVDPPAFVGYWRDTGMGATINAFDQYELEKLEEPLDNDGVRPNLKEPIYHKPDPKTESLFSILDPSGVDMYATEKTGQRVLFPEMLEYEEGVWVNDKGAKQTRIAVRSDLFPPLAYIEVSKILTYGENNYGRNNWCGIPAHEQLNHAMTHVTAVQMISRQISPNMNAETKKQLRERILKEAAQATCRMLFFLDNLTNEYYVNQALETS